MSAEAPPSESTGTNPSQPQPAPAAEQAVDSTTMNSNNKTSTNNSRKRARSVSPKDPSSSSFSGISNNKNKDRDLEVLRAQQLRDPLQRNTVLNELLRLSSVHDKPLLLHSHEVLYALVDVAIYEHLQKKKEKSSKEEEEDSDFSSKTVWSKAPSRAAEEWAQACKKRLNDPSLCLPPKHQRQQQQQQAADNSSSSLATLRVILMILRNLSYTGANVRMMVYSANTMDLLVGCLFDTMDSSGFVRGDNTAYTTDSSISSTRLVDTALQTLLNVAPYLDISGQRMVTDRLFYDNSSYLVPHPETFNQASQWGWNGMYWAKRWDAREDRLAATVQKEFIMSVTGTHYLTSVWSVFSALRFCLTNHCIQRHTLLMGLDVLLEWIQPARIGVVGTVSIEDDPYVLPSIRAVLVNMPDCMLIRLVECLSIPKQGPESMDYVDPTKTLVLKPSNKSVSYQQGGYDASIDTDLRDRALEVLVPLMELDSPRVAARIGKCCHSRPLLDAILPILTTTVGKNEASMVASQFLREFSKASENEMALVTIQERLVELASRDARIAQLVWNHLYVQPELESSEDEESVEGVGIDNAVSVLETAE
jgi:hypothetical protein